MHGTQHLNFGLVALEFEFLGFSEFGAALLEAGRKGSDAPFDEIWLRPGRLQEEQFELVVNRLFGGVTGDQQTLAFGGQVVVKPAPIMPAAGENSVEITGDEITGPVDLTAEEDAQPSRYLRVGVCATGGMGVITECIDQRLGRRVALKALRSDIGNREVARSMLEREAIVTGSLQHPNIIPVYDAGQHAGIGSYYVMRLVNEPTLESVIEDRRGGDPSAARDGLDRLLRYFIQVCDAVDYAHSRGVIHCDLKPANILLGEFGEVLVVDWGLAYRVDEGTMYRGGTPGYMAPEQLRGEGKGIDARTDVFALGAILYELVSLQAAFGELSPSDFVRGMVETGASILKPPPRPSECSGEITVPAELEDVCMKALSLDKEDRYDSARAIAVDIENFIAGTKERERRKKRAAELVEDGALLAQNFGDGLETRAEILDEIRGLRVKIDPWASVTKKRPVWEAQERLQVTEAVGIRTLQAAVSLYEQALDEVSGHAGARRGLAELYRVEMRRAQERRDEYDRIYFEALVKQYSEQSERPATIGIDNELASVHPVLSVYDERDHRLTAQPWRHSPIQTNGDMEVPPGSYVLKLRPTGQPPAFLPVLLRSGHKVSPHIDLQAISRLGRGEVYVAAGAALLGASDPATGLAELREQEVPDFVINSRPVTFAEYLRFLTWEFESGRDASERHLPADTNEAPYWKWTGTKFEPAGISILSRGISDPGRLPAFGIRIDSARAYAGWLSEQTGSELDLPTEEQWEKAARGVDGRRYPWGDQFDASFCKMRESRPGPPLPEVSGLFARDTSPWGVHDTAGGLADWVLQGARDTTVRSAQAISRGGAWCDWSADCDLGARRIYRAEEHPPRVGFRLARTL